METGSPAKRFLFHPLFDGDIREGSAILAAMAAHSPGFNPFFLDVRLTAARAHKHTLDVMDLANFLHTGLLAEMAERIAQVSSGLQDGQPRPHADIAPGYRAMAMP
jgi:hypothetical protein